jgi:predicted DCC family thiol-disulfide oxidoreductase YuxK
LNQTQGWFLYDGQCQFCLTWADRLRPYLTVRGIALAPLQTVWVKERLKIPQEKLLEEMRVITKDDRVLGGADAFVYLAGQIGWAWPLYALSFMPGFKPLMRAVYREIAKRRSCTGEKCHV